ncbi:MAG: VCBS repeat-containing protein [Myxococcales bacterium]|nr:VCBS repeat-containing protein [Myxococcales bacterium]
MFLPTRRSSITLTAALLALTPTLGWAQTGVDDDRVSLPQGPGSLEGVGDDVELDPNMGAMTYNVAIELPRGFSGATPSLALSYSSASGSGPLGIGWSMRVPVIGRMTSRGAPEYDTEDLFDADGAELVQVGTAGGDLVYRARFEKAFTRYRWVSAGGGAEGYWVAESADGSRSYFGADAQGNLQSSARRTRPAGGTAEYCLVETVDVYGHSVRYAYTQGSGTVPLLSRISWLDDGTGANDVYAVVIGYEARPDLLSDASRGYEELIADRVSSVQVLNAGSVIREYVLSYEADATSGGFSRLARVQRYGLGGQAAGALYPMVFGFEYSQALGVECSGADCDRPYLVDMGNLSGGVDIANGRATLVDIDADGLPDVLDTSDSAGHRFLINTLSPNGAGFDHAFASGAMSAVGGTGSFQLGGTGLVQTFDVNGDGRSDLLNVSTGAWLANGGSGDWFGVQSFGDITGLSGVDLGAATFIDIDDDKRVDLVTSTGQTTTLYRNEGDRFSVQSISPLGVALGGTSRVQFADMNGDGLNDPVELLASGAVRYRLNLGRGQWSAAWRSVSGLSVNPTDLARADFEDLNGDGVSDLVIVNQTQIQYAINRNGDRFDPFVTITSADVDGDLPERVAGTTVLLADMNANGSQDVVWFTSSGNVRYLELFPRRPNLLTKVTNGIGSVQAVQYTTAAQAAAAARAAGTPWTHTLPIPMQLVSQVDRYVTLTGAADGSGLHEITRMTYRDGFYDGVEKQYRGFEQVQTLVAGDAFQEEAVTEYTFDVGRALPHRNGLALSEVVLSDGRILTETHRTYEDCALAEVPTPSELAAAGRPGVYFPCETAEEVVHQEGLTSPSDWKTVRTEMIYDGYGQVTVNAALGVVGVDGDELYTETEYASSASRWQLGLPSRERVYDAPGSAEFSETLTYYDGEAFVGLPSGQATEGFVSRQTRKVDTRGTLVTSVRARRDAHGNSVETIDPNGSVDDTTQHRRSYTYDDTGLFLTVTDLAVGDHALRRESRYERDFQKVVEVTKWMLVKDGAVQSNRDSSTYRYDAFGRLSAEILPGDEVGTPSRVYGYDLADPVSTIRMQARSVANGALDEEVFQCVDGKGRVYQTRTLLGAGKYQVSGFVAFNARGVEVERWQPWVSSAGSCDFTVPSAVLSSTTRFDAEARMIERTQPGAAIYGEDVVTRTAYLPLATAAYDGEDTDEGGAHADTPLLTRVDGLGRTIAIHRTAFENGALVESGETLHYDSTGTFSGYTDAEGDRHLLTTDLLGRTIEVANPNFGTIVYTYDDASNLVSVTDGRAVTERRVYDGQNRILERFEEGRREGSLVTWHYDQRPELCAATECTNLPGQLAAVTYPVALVDGVVLEGVERMGYDVRRRRVFASRSFGDLATLPTRWGFDNQDRATSVTSPDGTETTRSLDAAGRLVALPGYVEGIDYEDRGMQEVLRMENGARVRRTYDALMRVENLRHLDASGAAIYDLALGFDRADNLAEITDGAGGSVDLSAQYTLDDWYRVTEAGYADRTETFEFDVRDRIMARDGEALTYDPARPLAVTKMGGLAMAYDDSGRLLSRGGATFDRDELGRITEISRGGETAGVHAYGAVDRVLQMTADGALVLYGFERYEVRDGVGTTFVSIGEDRVARHERTDLALGFYPDANGNAKIDAGDALLATEYTAHVLGAAAARLLVEHEDAVAFLHTDYTGSHVAATDAAGAVRGKQAFLLHGATRSTDGYVGAYGFTGQEHDATTGFVHMTHRDLDSSTGRWDAFDPKFLTLDADAMADLGEASTGYAYVANNPGTHRDPSGLGTFKDLFKVKRTNRAGPQTLGKDVKVRLGRGGQLVVKPKLNKGRFWRNMTQSAFHDRRQMQHYLNTTYKTTETKQAFLQAWNTTKTERTRSGPVEDSRFDTRIDSVTSRIEDVELSERSETGVYWGAPPSLAQ